MSTSIGDLIRHCAPASLKARRGAAFASRARESDIAFVLDQGFSRGGSARVALSLLRSWVEDGRSITLISLRAPEDDAYSGPPEVQRIILGGYGRSPNKLVGFVRNIPRIRRLRRAVRESHASVVISFLTGSNVRTALACIGLGKRVILCERNDTSRQQHRWPWSLLRRLVYRYADVITANSHIALDDMARYVPKRKLAFVANPVVFSTRAATPGKSSKILAAGRLVPQKNHALLIQALSYLKDHQGAWNVEILGDGPERPKLAALARAHAMSDRVTLHGWVADPSPRYEEAGIFVLPSLYEGTPNTLLEAMAHGLPCVVADCLPGALEHVESGVSGFTFRSGDSVDLAGKIAILLADPELRTRLGAAGRERMRAFTQQRVMTAWNALLDDRNG